MPFERARHRTSSQQWAYTWRGKRTPYLKTFYSDDQWEKANIKRRIKDLDARIQSGKGWLNTIPSTDPRHPKWTKAIKALHDERITLAAELAKLTT